MHARRAARVRGALPAPVSELAKSRSTGSVCTREVGRNTSTRMSRHTGTCERATNVDQDTTGGGGNVRGHGRHARVVISPSTRSRITGCSLWWPVPGQCQNRQIGVFGELAKEVIEATARAKEG